MRDFICVEHTYRSSDLCHARGACEPSKRARHASPTLTDSSKVRATLIRMPADDSCLFHAVGHHLNMGGHELRQHVVRWMRNNMNCRIAGTCLADWLGLEGENGVHDYITKMSKNRTWGGGTELALLTLMYPRLSFYLFRHLEDDKYEFYAKVGDGNKQKWLHYDSMLGHYDALQPTYHFNSWTS